jgi:hypothetical protein
VKSNWWTSSRTENRFSSPGHCESVWPKPAFPPTTVPRGVVPLFGVRHRSRSDLFGWSLPPCRFHGFAVFRKRSVDAEAPTPPVSLDLLQGTPDCPGRHLPTPATLMRFRAPTATSARRSTDPGFHTRFVPPTEFLTLLTVSSLRHLPISRIGAARGVHPTERFPPAEPYAFRRHDPHAVFDIAFFCSEDQEITMPRGFRALLTAGIRIRSGSEDPVDRCSHGVRSPLQSLSPRSVEPASRLLPSCASNVRSQGDRTPGTPGP